MTEIMVRTFLSEMFRLETIGKPFIWQEFVKVRPEILKKLNPSERAYWKRTWKRLANVSTYDQRYRAYCMVTKDETKH